MVGYAQTTKIMGLVNYIGQMAANGRVLGLTSRNNRWQNFVRAPITHMLSVPWPMDPRDIQVAVVAVGCID